MFKLTVDYMYELDVEHNIRLVFRPSPGFPSVKRVLHDKQREAGQGPGNEANIAQLLFVHDVRCVMCICECFQLLGDFSSRGDVITQLGRDGQHHFY